MQRELESYFKARDRLAEMVGGDPDTFSDSDIAVSRAQYTIEQFAA